MRRTWGKVMNLRYPDNVDIHIFPELGEAEAKPGAFRSTKTTTSTTASQGAASAKSARKRAVQVQGLQPPPPAPGDWPAGSKRARAARERRLHTHRVTCGRVFHACALVFFAVRERARAMREQSWAVGKFAMFRDFRSKFREFYDFGSKFR